LLEIHAAGFALSARSRADYEIMRPVDDRLDELWYERWNVAAIAIEKYYDVVPRLRERDRASACCARSPITTRRNYDSRAGFTRPLRSTICTVVINDDHFAGHAGRETFANHARDRFFLV
jgi:hypothetical protein